MGSSRISLTTAKNILGLAQQSNNTFTMRELRDAYFKAAKQCHPDLQAKDGKYLNKDFHALTEAYELLQQHHHQIGNNASSKTIDDYDVTIEEDKSFRFGCKEWLGLSAEVVEESKKCPIFREWLQGRTDGALRWNHFFALHGGMAPMLRPPENLLLEGGEEDIMQGVLKRRRKRR